MHKKIIFINSHPIQYFAPMYKGMNERGMETSCWYCSDATVKGGIDQQFGLKIKWDIPLLEGYDFKFFKNHSWKPSHYNGFFGLINFGMIKELFKIPKSIVIVHGYHYFTMFCLLMLGKIRGHKMCLRCEMPQKQEALKTGLTQKVKKIFLKYILFPRIDFFLYIGTQNRLFYKSYGIAEERMLLCPYAVDNERFGNEYAKLLSQIPEIKEKNDIPADAKVIIYSAKYIDKKRPLDILEAFGKLNSENTWLIMVGEGELRSEMESLINDKNIKNVILTGFVNQSKISEYYAIGDLFVMCSGVGETWGLSVNEAMNFSLPLLISDLSGCADDLVKEGINGYTFKTGDIADLVSKLNKMLSENGLAKSKSSLDIIREYSYDTVARNLRVLVN